MAKPMLADETLLPGTRLDSDLTSRELANAMPMGLALVDPGGVILFANTELERMTGHAEGALSGANVDMLLPAHLRQRHVTDRLAYVRAPSQRSMGAGRDLYACRADGSEFPVEIGLKPTTFNGQSVTLATVIDVTARRDTEAAFRSIFEAAPYGMILADGSGKIAHSNTQLDAMFGYETGELTGQPIEILLPHRFHAGHVAMRNGYIANPEQRVMGKGRDLTGRRKDGMEFPLEIGLTHVVTSQGRMSCASVVDITERNRAELQLREASAQLEEFTHVASHDLRSPVRGIANLIEFIGEDYGEEAPEPVRRNLQRMADRIGGMERLIDDLLTYARAGRRVAQVETIDLGTIVREVIELQAPDDSVSINISLPDETFEGARTPLTTVIRNLLSNAIKHHDRAEKNINIRAHMAGNHCILDVTDDGPGIPQAAQKRAFRLFQTLSTSERKGTGLGLAVVQRLVEGHGGTITLSSRDGERGCQFSVAWPRYMRSDLDE
ncbi:MAG: PAS domain-containing sensor histidine kinase [Sphingobium sp.]